MLKLDKKVRCYEAIADFLPPALEAITPRSKALLEANHFPATTGPEPPGPRDRRPAQRPDAIECTLSAAARYSGVQRRIS